MNEFIGYAPIIFNFLLFAEFIVIQFFLCRFVQGHHFNASETLGYLFSCLKLIVMPVIMSVLVFVFYELFILNSGTDFSAVCMFIAYYLVPIAALICFVIYGRYIFVFALSGSPVKIRYRRVIIPIIILAFLFYLLVIMFNLPFVCISFIIPFLSCFYGLR